MLSGKKAEGEDDAEEAKEDPADDEDEEGKQEKAKNSDETSEEEVKVPTRPLTGKSPSSLSLISFCDDH